MVRRAARARPKAEQAAGETGPGPSDESWPVATVHRPVDGLRALVALIALVAVLSSISVLPLGSEEVSADVSKWLSPFPRWLAGGAAVVAGFVSFCVVVVATVVLIRRSPAEALRAWVAALAAAATAAAAMAVWRADHGAVALAVVYGTRPSVFTIDAAFLAFMLASDLLHRARWARWTTACGAVLLLGGLADGALTPFAFVIVVLWGAVVGWATRWALGIPSSGPRRAELAAWLADLDLDAAELRPAPGRAGELVYGVLADGRPIEVRLASIDTDWSGVWRWMWTALRLRPTATGHTAVTSRSRLEELALVCALSGKARVPAPQLLALHAGPHDNLGLVTARPPGDPLGPTLSSQVATSLFQSLSALHGVGVAHRDLRKQNLVATDTCGGFSSMDSALLGATDLACLLDVAQLVTTVAGLARPDTAVQAMRAGYHKLDEAAVAAVLQPVALASWGWSEAREAKGCMEAVRSRLVQSRETVSSVKLERFSWRTVISAVALVIAAYVLVGQLSSVNLAGALAHMKGQWFALALAGSALTYLAAASNILAFVRKRLSLVRAFFVQLAGTFVGVAMPSAVGSVAVNARFLTSQGIDEGDVVADITLSQVVNAATTVLLVVVLVLLTGAGISHAKVVPSTDLLLAIAALAGLIVVLALVPRTRGLILRTVVPRLKGLFPKLLEALSQPARLAVSAGSSLLLNVGYITAFIASLSAVGAQPPILATAVVYMVAGFIGAATPTPGGLGGVEAALVAGLAGIGIPAAHAIPAVVVFRFATFWLPIPIGWLSYQGLQRSGTL
jgi:uncharacterized protein (TIRG00374 family)